ncbi:hypothetical protein [Modestobacter sp. Leaf380]|uniref:hypothetical protein n=1 Tax=Modestobacter sp. Leaf380 TaxID=1736356 RepID=UPI0006F69B7C|nr:hypothetical protein [Modestobacter sp. Leaf380]KQS66366.1 hypothetical protein ASG41_13780 [Modestobacter sp. Leaf380]
MTGPTPDWGAQLRGLADAAAGLIGGLTATVSAAPAEGPAGDHSAECRSCPVCTALAVLRGRRPDLSEALADVLATAAAALRAHTPTETTAPAPQSPEEHVSPTPPPAPVQRIEVA